MGISSKSTIVITGGAGFIGSHLVERLLGEGYRVRVLDDLSTGSLENLAACRNDPRLEITLGPVSGQKDLNRILAGSSYTFHLAAAVGVDLVVQHPIKTIHTNLRETEAVLEAASGNRTPVLLASTSEVYGKSPKPTFDEEDDLLIGPPNLARWSYACSKLMDEFLAMAYARERGVPVVVARLFNTVGPRQTGRYGMVLPRFIEAAMLRRPIRVFGDGNQTRCFCFVNDTVEALFRLMKSPDAIGQVVNVGTDQEISIAALARRVMDLLGSSVPIQRVPYSDAYAPGFEDMLRRRPVIEKCRRLTGFRPATPLDEIIRSTAAAFRNSSAAPRGDGS
jgi:UDP-glucose 4-epimerase